MTIAPRCGDHVLHRPSGETWVVAYADPVIDRLAWSLYLNGHRTIWERITGEFRWKNQ